MRKNPKQYQAHIVFTREDGELICQCAERKGVQPGVLIRMIVKEHLASQQGKEKE